MDSQNQELLYKKTYHLRIFHSITKILAKETYKIELYAIILYKSVNHKTKSPIFYINNITTSLTVKQFINEHKIVLYIFLVDFPEIACHNLTHFGEKFKHHNCIYILLAHL